MIKLKIKRQNRNNHQRSNAVKKESNRMLKTLKFRL